MENLGREVKIIKNQKEITQPRGIITKTKNSLHKQTETADRKQSVNSSIGQWKLPNSKDKEERG